MKGAHQTGFGVKLDTTTKYNRLKNIADKGSAVRRGECLFRKRKMAAQRNAVRVCLCVRRTTPSTDSETGKTKKIISRIILTTTHLLVYIIMLRLPLAIQNVIYN